MIAAQDSHRPIQEPWPRGAISATGVGTGDWGVRDGVGQERPPTLRQCGVASSFRFVMLQNGEEGTGGNFIVESSQRGGGFRFFWSFRRSHLLLCSSFRNLRGRSVPYAYNRKEAKVGFEICLLMLASVA